MKKNTNRFFVLFGLVGMSLASSIYASDLEDDFKFEDQVKLNPAFERNGRSLIHAQSLDSQVVGEIKELAFKCLKVEPSYNLMIKSQCESMKFNPMSGIGEIALGSKKIQFVNWINAPVEYGDGDTIDENLIAFYSEDGVRIGLYSVVPSYSTEEFFNLSRAIDATIPNVQEGVTREERKNGKYEYRDFLTSYI